jgi:D-xylose transport system permease protein
VQNQIKSWLKQNGAWIALLLLALTVTILTQGGFFTPRNLTNLMRQCAINGVLASGMTLIILTGGIDLSIGSLVALSGVVVGVTQVYWGWSEMGWWGALGSMGLGIAAGGVAGFATGGLVSMLGIPPFVITLGMMVIARGVALIVSNGSGISPVGDQLRSFGEDYLSTPVTILLVASILIAVLFRFRKNSLIPVLCFSSFGYAFYQYKGFPVPGVFLAAVLVLVSFILMQTTLGRAIYAVGSNETAAHWAGVPIRKVKWFVYAVMGLLAGLAGVLLTARLNGASPTAGGLFELDAIAAVVIGGTSLKGGSGSVIGSLVGALTIATLDNGMDLLGVPSFYQMLLKGFVIILAVSLDKTQRQGT